MQLIINKNMQNKLIYACHKMAYRLKKEKYYNDYVQKSSEIKYFKITYEEVCKHLNSIEEQVCLKSRSQKSDDQLYSLIKKYKRQLLLWKDYIDINVKISRKKFNFKKGKKIVKLMNSHSSLFRYIKYNKIKYKIDSSKIVNLVNPALIITNGKF